MVVAEVQDLESGESGESGDGGDLVVDEVQVLEAREFLETLHVTDVSGLAAQACECGGLTRGGLGSTAEPQGRVDATEQVLIGDGLLLDLRDLDREAGGARVAAFVCDAGLDGEGSGLGGGTGYGSAGGEGESGG